MRLLRGRSRSYDPLKSDEHLDPDSEDGYGATDSAAEAAAATPWTRNALALAYAMVWLTFLVEGMLAGTMAILTPYVTSAFAQHALTPTVGVLSSVLGGVTNLTLAKVLDVFGRPQGLLFCILLAAAGLAMMASCGSIQAYAAAQVLQTVGNNGIQYSLGVFVSDTSSLRNRGLMLSVVSSPNLMTCFLAGPMAQWFLDGQGWRWAFGLFAVLVPLATLPLFGLLMHHHRKAEEFVAVAVASNDCIDRTAAQSFAYYCRQFDAVGLLLLSAGVGLILMPLNLYTLQGLDSLLVLGTCLVGMVLLAAFVVWEKHYAAITFIPYSLLLDGTVFGACVLSASLCVSYWCWNSFFSSYLQVVNGLSVQNAGFVVQSYTVCSVLCSIVVGALIHQTGRFKPVCLYVGIPLSALGSAMMMYFCKNESNVVYLVACQICISVAAGTIMVCDEVAILAAASSQYVAVCLAVLGLFGNIGSAVGLTVSSTLWQSVFPAKLREYLPAQELPKLDEIYTNITTQLSYPMGSEARLAIQHSYEDAQTSMLTVGTAVWIVGLVGTLMWRDINVITMKQSKRTITQ